MLTFVILKGNLPWEKNISCCVYIPDCCHRAGYICTFLFFQLVMLNNAWISPSGMLTFRGEVNFVGQSDEDQGTDNEICTVATVRDGLGGRESESISGSNKTEGLWKNCLLVIIYPDYDLSLCSLLCMWKKHIIKAALNKKYTVSNFCNLKI